MKPVSVAIALLSMIASAKGQNFEGVYTVGRTSLVARALSEQDRAKNLFNVVYAKGDKGGTMVSLTEDPNFELVFDEHLGERQLGTFYFTKAWKGKPLEGYYVKLGSSRKLPVKYLGEAPTKPR